MAEEQKGKKQPFPFPFSGVQDSISARIQILPYFRSTYRLNYQ